MRAPWPCGGRPSQGHTTASGNPDRAGGVSTLVIRDVFRFPNPVNEVSARLVAGGVVTMALLALAGRQMWLLVPLAYGFVARVLTGPTLSPLGQLVTRVVTPRLGVAPRLVPGPPKRFAQGIGAAVSVSAAVLHFGLGLTGAAQVLLALLVVAATLESVFAYCIGCRVFAVLMRWNVIPDGVCERCNDLSLSPATSGR